MRVLLTAVAAALLSSQASPPPAFEVAAIRRNTSIETDGRLAMQPGGRFRAINFDGFNLIAFAYRTKPRNLFPSQIVGAPDWLKRERYDITAKITSDIVASGPSDPLQTPKLVRALLEDRFRLRAHRETREQPVYELRVLPKQQAAVEMRRVDVDCVADRARCRVESSPGHLKAGGLATETLAAILSNLVGRIVVDRTGLAGQFDLELNWADEPGSDKPSLFSAVHERLGLKLEPAREQVDVVVIDHVERPTED